MTHQEFLSAALAMPLPKPMRLGHDFMCPMLYGGRMAEGCAISVRLVGGFHAPLQGDMEQLTIIGRGSYSQFECDRETALDILWNHLA